MSVDEFESSSKNISPSICVCSNNVTSNVGCSPHISSIGQGSNTCGGEENVDSTYIHPMLNFDETLTGCCHESMKDQESDVEKFSNDQSNDNVDSDWDPDPHITGAADVEAVQSVEINHEGGPTEQFYISLNKQPNKTKKYISVGYKSFRKRTNLLKQ